MDNTVCLEEEDPTGQGRSLEDRCPIVDLEIVRKPDLEAWYRKNGRRNLQDNANVTSTDDAQTNQTSDATAEAPAETTNDSSPVENFDSDLPVEDSTEVSAAAAVYKVVNGWTRIDITDDLVLLYSKMGNKLPLTTFTVDVGVPCMDADS